MGSSKSTLSEAPTPGPRQLLDRATGEVETCTLEWSTPAWAEPAWIQLTRADGSVYRTADGSDHEDGLLELWDHLDNAGLALGCVRFKKNAIVSGLSRSMSHGDGCYLLRRLQPVSVRFLADSLAPCDAREAVTRDRNRRYRRAHNRTALIGAPITMLGDLIAQARS